MDGKNLYTTGRSGTHVRFRILTVDELFNLLARELDDECSQISVQIDMMLEGEDLEWHEC